jgi:hypothetical protein
MHTHYTTLILAAVLLGGVVGIPAVAQPFDITTEQSSTDKQAVITVKLATNNTVVIPPNGTVIEVPGNITQIDNDTVVIAPENETVTELPGNVTVITPPEPEPCGCPPANATAPSTGGGGPIEPVFIRPAEGQEVVAPNGTIFVPSNETTGQPVPILPPVNDTSTGGNDTGEGPTLPVEPVNNTGIDTGDNQTTDGGGGSGEIPAPSEGNDTSLSPAASTSNTPWWMPLSRT